MLFYQKGIIPESPKRGESGVAVVVMRIMTTKDTRLEG